MKTIKDKNYSFNHVKKRLTERYNLDITIDEYDKLCQMVIDNKGTIFINSENNTQEIYNILIGLTTIKVVWSVERKLITTVLPIRQHHIWCSHQLSNPDTCKMCDKFYKLYPMNGITPDELLKKHFPDAIKREGT